MSSVIASSGPRSKRSYLTMAEFSHDIFTYTTTFNERTRVTSGTLTDFSGNSNCPRGRFLYENGRKLYPDAHPGVNTYMVGVFDPVSFISGYIDPNSKIFTPMNTDKPVDTAAMEGADGGVFGINPNGNTETDLAQPVFTRGDVLAEGNMDISGNAEIHKNLIVDLSGHISGNFDVDGTVDISGTTTMHSTLTIATGDLSVVTGVLKLNCADGATGLANAVCGRVQLNGANDAYVDVSTSACTSNSRILLSYWASASVTLANCGCLFTTDVGSGSFRIRSTTDFDANYVNWLIINDATA